MLGKGGMGEVYRADDLELGQSVALKFLPERVATDVAAMNRFRNEVRTARQVAHPNVCRMYDIGEADGHVFLSMEYIDGEDLSQVLRRMGRPTSEKALEIARQLCLGLAAAHENGVLHRDLKPANVMIDGRGRVRITDFGLAGLVDELAAQEERAGTPAYMAPEQLSSGTVSVRSDVYALGLVLHEVFSGKRVFDTNSISELKQLHTSSSMASISTSGIEVDPAIERVILRCLEKDPKQRPSSVYAVLGALPGGDPLAAALAAGETPSPELLAEAGEAGGLAPPIAIGCLAVALCLLLFNIWAAPQHALYGMVSLDTPEQELALRARDMIKEFSGRDIPEYRAFGFTVHNEYLKHVENTDPSSDRWNRLANERTPAVAFWYRVSHDVMNPSGLHFDLTRKDDPPLSGGGSALIELDPAGRLLYLASVPEPKPADAPTESARAPTLLFERAALIPDDFSATEVVKTPPVPCDDVKAFRGIYSEKTGETVVVQCGSYHGRPNYFEIIGPWNQPGGELPANAMPQAPWFVAVVGIATLIVTILLVRRNLKLGRGDRKGAFRLALGIGVTMMVAWAIRGIEIPGSVREIFANLLWDKPVGHALYHAFLFWLLYIALEPYARRIWPQTLVSWTRLLIGRFRDPQLGKDILVGGLLAGTTGVLTWAFFEARIWMGESPQPQIHGLFDQLGFRAQLGHVVGGVDGAIAMPMQLLVVLVILRLFLRKTWAAIVAFLLLAVVVFTLGSLSGPDGYASVALGVVQGLFAVGLITIVLIRFGLVACIVAAFSMQVFSNAPLTFDFSKWYAGPALLPVVACAALFIYGFYIALAGRPLFRDELLETG